MMHFQLNSFETKVSCLDVTVFATCLIVGFLKIPPRGDKSASRGGYFFYGFSSHSHRKLPQPEHQEDCSNAFISVHVNISKKFL